MCDRARRQELTFCRRAQCFLIQKKTDVPGTPRCIPSNQVIYFLLTRRSFTKSFPDFVKGGERGWLAEVSRGSIRRNLRPEDLGLSSFAGRAEEAPGTTQPTRVPSS